MRQNERFTELAERKIGIGKRRHDLNLKLVTAPAEAQRIQPVACIKMTHPALLKREPDVSKFRTNLNILIGVSHQTRENAAGVFRTVSRNRQFAERQTGLAVSNVIAAALGCERMSLRRPAISHSDHGPRSSSMEPPGPFRRMCVQHGLGLQKSLPRLPPVANLSIGKSAPGVRGHIIANICMFQCFDRLIETAHHDIGRTFEGQPLCILTKERIAGKREQQRPIRLCCIFPGEVKARELQKCCLARPLLRIPVCSGRCKARHIIGEILLPTVSPGFEIKETWRQALSIGDLCFNAPAGEREPCFTVDQKEVTPLGDVQIIRAWNDSKPVGRDREFSLDEGKLLNKCGRRVERRNENEFVSNLRIS